jgi:hypothetical protein
VFWWISRSKSNKKANHSGNAGHLRCRCDLQVGKYAERVI